MSETQSGGPLHGVRVLELGQLIAGPFAGSMLAYFGAEVIKVEPPGRGDPLRNWRVVQDGTSLWWHSISRNKKCITLDLKSSRGRELARRLALSCDVLLENFRPGTLEKWGMDPDALRREKPGLVVARISGFGQTGPYADRPGFASACEGYGGLRYVTGHPGEPPVRPNLSLGDSLAAVHAVLGVLMALLNRERGGDGQVVDVAIYESVFNMLEGVVAEYSGAGVVRQPSGTTVTGIVPTNTYRCADGGYVVIGGNGDSIFRRLMQAAGRDDLAADPQLADNAGRVAREGEIDAAIGAWTAGLDASQVLAVLCEAAVPCGPIYSVAEMFTDPQYRARNMFEPVQVGQRELELPAMAPKLSDTPGATRWAGPALGEHTAQVLAELLDVDAPELQQLRDAGIV